MSKKRKRRLMKKLHKWPALVISVFIIIWAFSGITLNHRFTFSSFDVNRDLLPSEHNYRNWNNAAIRGSVRIDSNKVLFYGNVGIWRFNELDGSWQDERKGLPAGADHHKINSLLKTSGDRLYAGTRFGLYLYDEAGSLWESVPIPGDDVHVVDLAEINDSLWIMTRSHLWKIPLHGEPVITLFQIPQPRGYDNKIGLFKTLWVIHSGEIYGLFGKLMVDFVAFTFTFLILSGLIYFFFPRMIRKRKKKSREVTKLGRWNRFSIKWHNKIGIWLVAILILTALTGMFLRPPLLIAIANSRVGKIPFSVLDDGNPWYDHLRRILYIEDNNSVLLATSEGIYHTDPGLKASPVLIIPQPPASVMGYNVFARHADGRILVGSFTGIYAWDPESGMITDHITGLPFVATSSPGIPIGANMISGYHLDSDGNEFLFDYNAGVAGLHHDLRFPEMPEFISSARMPLWNFALEVHTARLFKPLIGDFYILFIPLFGLSVLVILVTGIILWIRKYKRIRKK
jgi:hypothetical protein